MNMRASNSISLSPSATVRDAVRVINEKSSTLAIVVTPDGLLLGTITDGDVRRGLLKGCGLDHPVAEIMNSRPVSLPLGTSPEEILRVMRTRAVSQIVFLDSDRKVAGFELQADLLETPNRFDVPVIILAGGFGKRLYPLTKEVPKPMLPVRGHPLLELSIRRLASQGFWNFFLAVYHLNDVIKSHLRDGSHLGVRIRYIEEPTPLGTAGALRLIKDELKGVFLVINGDLLTSASIDHMVRFHESEKNELTSAVKEHSVTVPYGVVKLDRGRIVGLEEKPIVRQFVNVGIYAIDPAVLSLLPPTGPFNMTDLILAAIENQMKVEGFPLHEYWQDIGLPEDYQRANNQWMEDHPSPETSR